ncbi:segregation/condensation protein A [Bacillus sp. 165]|uniref:segregation/condensation protein A n=1 Tax=Bacillus sp. 165 TaxID=1529117 RepID=UPI001ADD5945|nr:segregation/condensation protein A [Bacillus sp. 165]
MQYSVKIDAFEGPLDLLLHLINRYEIDIYNIPVAEITEQYLTYIHTMKELELDVASEFLVMAATLLAIKSKMLLPKQENELFDDEFSDVEEDPREELMQRLLEYKKFKTAASNLKERGEERSHVFTRPPVELGQFEQEIETKLPIDVTLYDMLSAFQKLMRRKKLQKPMQTRITRQEISIEKRMKEILQELDIDGRKSFFSLFPFEERDMVVVTFLAVLELMKTQEIEIEQERNFDEIFIMKQRKEYEAAWSNES